MQKPLTTPIRYLKGVGPGKAKLFNQLGIDTIEDLIYYFPRRYEDRSNFLPILKLKEGEEQTIKANVLTISQRQSWRRRRFNIFEAVVGDSTGKIYCVWFNQPYLKDYFKPGQTVILYGRIQKYKGRLQMSSPEFEFTYKDNDESLNVGRIIPVYSLIEGITQRSFRKFIKTVLNQYLSQINDFLPYDIRSRNNLLNLAKSLINIHFPESLELQKQSYVRLSFDEFFLFQIPLALRKLKKKEKQGIAHQVEGEIITSFMANLPFKLTQAQERVIDEIKQDLASLQPMQRLLQGDVGSGKTVVATIASLMAIQGGYQAGFMVPTEILAKQHYENIKSQIAKIKYNRYPLNMGLITSSINKTDKLKIYQKIKQGKINLVIGTHALLEEEVEFKNLGLVVIDEQHKFGVGQRALLPKKGISPDILIMTATPIPRTLAITLYGDLDISVINQLPPGRLPIKAIHFSENQVSEAYQLAKEQLLKKRQVYIVYPVIEESWALDMVGARKRYEELRSDEFKGFRLGLIHGRLPQKEQDRIMDKFKNQELDALIATTVLEVGIDVPNASCMIIEHAERFGLAQLHQLRGRVGRGREQSFCILVSDPQTREAKARIEVMIEYSDGFRIAEEDLKIRGPGEFFGHRQHGLAELKIANPLTQLQLLKRARIEAIKLINLDQNLTLRQNLELREKLLQRFPGYEKLMVVG
ncbi:MAG: ATP-dependent DNA helicase RecG [Candidatus Omnitrophota bacterium]|jgi:ATP-dependent DNA helicase RecG